VAGAVSTAAGIPTESPASAESLTSKKGGWQSMASRLGCVIRSAGQMMGRLPRRTGATGKQLLQVLLLPPASRPSASSGSNTPLPADRKSDSAAALGAAAARVGAGLVMLVAAGSLADAVDKPQHGRGSTRGSRNRASSHHGLYQEWYDSSSSSRSSGSWIGQLSGKLLSCLGVAGKLTGGSLIAAAKAPWSAVSWLRHRNGQKQRPWWQQQYNSIGGGGYEEPDSLFATSAAAGDWVPQPALMRSGKDALASGDASTSIGGRPRPSAAVYGKPHQLSSLPSSELHKLSVVHAAHDQHPHMYSHLMLRQGSSWR
jgi:hypothetical protein